MECHGDAVDDDAVDDNAVDDAAVDDDDMMMLLPCPCWLAADEDPPDGADVSGCPGSLIKCGSLIAILMMTIDGLIKNLATMMSISGPQEPRMRRASSIVIPRRLKRNSNLYVFF